ncbi:MAG: hypothetical protein ACLFV2_05275 [Desulfurivibrionaceae bacterium]
MNNTRINQHSKAKTGHEKAQETSRAEVEFSTGSLIATGFFTALIGIWVAACFIGGLIASGGPLAMLKSWFTAVTGM